jgi:hypothetical protein
MSSIVIALLLVAGPATAPADAGRPTVTRKGSQSGFGDTSIKFPAAKVDKAPRITEDDGGYLDLARSKDGRELWTRRSWDDGSTDVNHFKLNWTGERKLILQFVDGVTEPWKKGPEAGVGRNLIKRADGTMIELLLDVWPIDPERAEAFSLVTHKWIPLVPARKESPGDPRKVHWMTFVERCPEVKGSCVYHGAPDDVCRRYRAALARTADEALWIAPRKCFD